MASLNTRLADAYRVTKSQKPVKLDFITKSTHLSNMDVSLSAVGSEKKRQVQIVLRNNSDAKITRTGYISVAFTEDRLYFREENKAVGFKVCANGTTNLSRYVKLTNPKLTSWTEEHSGDYPLEYDKENELYYIDTE